MNSHEPVELTLRVGESSRSIPVVALAAAVHRSRSEVEHALRILALGEPTEGAPTNQQPGAHPEGINPTTTVAVVTEERRTRVEVTGDASTILVEILRTLGPETNALAISKLVAMTPVHVLREALSLTTERPAHEIRASRAAYFTALVRGLMDAKRAPNLYA